MPAWRLVVVSKKGAGRSVYTIVRSMPCCFPSCRRAVTYLWWKDAASSPGAAAMGVPNTTCSTAAPAVGIQAHCIRVCVNRVHVVLGVLVQHETVIDYSLVMEVIQVVAVA